MSPIAFRPTVLLAALLMALCSAAWPATGQTQTVQRIAAVVNQDIISMQDLAERMQLVIVTSGLPDNELTRERLAPQVLRGLVDETLQIQEADRLGVGVTEAEVDQAFATIADRNDLSADELRAYLAEEGVAERTMRRQLRAQIAWLKVVGREIGPRVNVTGQQIELAMREARAARVLGEVLLDEILLPVYDAAQEHEVLEDAVRLTEALRAGASFNAIATQFSAAASAEFGGNLGWVPVSAVPLELRDDLEAMRPGQISDPIRTSSGYHILHLRGRNRPDAGTEIAPDPVPPPPPPPPPPTLADAAHIRVELAQILFPLTEDDDEDSANAIADQAAALRPRLANCDAMDEVAEQIDAPLSGRIGWLRVGDLPPELGEAVLVLPLREVSPPFLGPAGITLLMVCDREGRIPVAEAPPPPPPPPPAPPPPEPLSDEELREEVADQIEREQIDRWVRRYLRDLRMNAFIELRI